MKTAHTSNQNVASRPVDLTYQRLLFGEADSPHRTEGLAMYVRNRGASAAVRHAALHAHHYRPRSQIIRPAPTQDLVLGYLPDDVVASFGIQTPGRVVLLDRDVLRKKLAKHALETATEAIDEVRRQIASNLRDVIESPMYIGRLVHHPSERPCVASPIPGTDKVRVAGLKFVPAERSGTGRDEWWASSIYLQRARRLKQLLRRREMRLRNNPA